MTKLFQFKKVNNALLHQFQIMEPIGLVWQIRKMKERGSGLTREVPLKIHCGILDNRTGEPLKIVWR